MICQNRIHPNRRLAQTEEITRITPVMCLPAQRKIKPGKGMTGVFQMKRKGSLGELFEMLSFAPDSNYQLFNFFLLTTNAREETCWKQLIFSNISHQKIFHTSLAICVFCRPICPGRGGFFLNLSHSCSKCFGSSWNVLPHVPIAS